MSEDRVGWYRSGTAELHLKSRTDLTAAEQVVTLPADPGLLDGDPVLAGDWLLLPLSSGAPGSRLLAADVDDPSVQRTVLASAGEHPLAADDGRPDLVSRDTGGRVRRNNGDGKGSFGGRTQLASGWSGHRSLS
ncbi:VCBS repeat-containing protein [Streptomyces sp. NPDC007162]|uniref:FG-GAP repeat domain-containing protein n=1 Tax=Streptomyces sp. NPDC007162 TaxID=3156917 RepID=UPI0033C80959